MNEPQDRVLVRALQCVGLPTGGTELSAEVDGERFYFRFPAGVAVEPRVEPFLTVALQEAMVRRVPLVVEDSLGVSARLLAGLEQWQTVVLAWNDEDFGRVTIQARAQTVLPGRDLVPCTFSGGIDSLYTYARHRHDITHVMTIQGYDGQSDEAEWQTNIAARQAFAERQGKGLLAIASNVRAFVDARRLSWGLVHGCLPAALAIAVGARRMYIAASMGYNDMYRWGSHPYLDPLWSTEATEVLHDGLEATRTQKTTHLAAQADLLPGMQVCWRSTRDNCGHCPKCVRTSLALFLLGKASPSIPPYASAEQLRWLKPDTPSSLKHTEALLRLALESGRPDIAATLRGYRRRFLIRYHLTEVLKAVSGPLMRRLSRRLAPKEWQQRRARLEGARNWLG